MLEITLTYFQYFRKKHLLACLFLLLSLSLYSQSNAVRVTTNMIPPYNVYLHDYVQNTGHKLRVNLRLRDINERSRQVRLKLYIEGRGLSIMSRDFIAPKPININSGEMRRLTADDIGYLFKLENLVGISSQQYAKPLKSGMYKFCFEVRDWVRNDIRLSQKTCSNPIFIQLEDPPFLHSPKKGENISENPFQRIVFTWEPRHLNRIGMEYEFTLTELWTSNISPEHVFLSSQPTYQTRTRATMLAYGPSNPNLLPGHRYAWRVRVVPRFGSTQTSRFKNDGYSEIYYFTYAYDCDPPTHIFTKAESSRKVRFMWRPRAKQTKFKVDYRIKGDNIWEEITTNNKSGTTRSGLSPGETYEFRVGALCGEVPFGMEDESYTYSDIHQFTMPKKDEKPYFNCGVAPKVKIKSRTPLEENLGVNEEFTASDFTVTVKQAKRQGDRFSGWGYIVVPFLGDAKIKVSFNRIKINKERQMYQGFVETTYDPDWKNVISTGEIANLFNGNEPSVSVNVGFPVKEIKVDPVSGKVVVIGKDGERKILDSGDTYEITDSEGKVFTVDSEGNVREVGELAEGGKPISNNTSGISADSDGNSKVEKLTASGVEIFFEPIPKEQKYGFDEVSDQASPGVRSLYESIDDKPLSYISVAHGRTEHVLARVHISDSTSRDSLIFKTLQSGVSVEAKPQGNDFKLSVKGLGQYGTETIIAAVKNGAHKQEIAGAFKVVYLREDRNVNLSVVPLGRNVPTGGEIERYLNDIYRGAGVHFSVKIASAFNISKTSFTETSSGFLKDYTNEQRELINTYKDSHEVSSNTYYVFYTNIRAKTDKIAGYMPLKRQFGFIFNGGDLHSLAHEIGHGAFGLQHPWQDSGVEAGKGETPWLMDYGRGTKISQYHWSLINDSENKLYLFGGDDEESELIPGHDLTNHIMAIINGYWCARDNEKLNFEYYYGAGYLEEFLYGISSGDFDGLDLENHLTIDFEKTKNLSGLKYVRTFYREGTVERIHYSQEGGGETGRIITRRSKDYCFLFKMTDPLLNQDNTLRVCFKSKEDRNKFKEKLLKKTPNNHPLYYANLKYKIENHLKQKQYNGAHLLLTMYPKCSFKGISSEHKVGLINSLTDEVKTENLQEQLLIRLFREYNDYEVDKLVDVLREVNLEQLFRSVDGAESEELTLAIKELAREYYRHNKPKNIGIVHLKKLGVLNGSRYKIIQSNKKVGLNFLTIDYDSPTTTDIIFEPTDPFNVVSVIKEDGTVDNSNTIPYILLLKDIIKDKEKTDHKKLMVVLDVASLFLGVGEFKAALTSTTALAKAYRAALASADLAATTTDVACQDSDSEVCEQWKEISGFVLAGVISASSIDLTYQSFKNSPKMQNRVMGLRDAEGVGRVVKKTKKIFGRSVISEINGFSDDIGRLAKKQGLSVDDFKRLQQKRYGKGMTPVERDKIDAIRNAIPMPDGNTILQKVIPKSDIQKYLSGQRNQIGGFITTAKDAKHLNTFEDLYYGVRLDIKLDDGTRLFKLNDGSCGVIRYRTPKPKAKVARVVDGVGKKLELPYTGSGFTGGKKGRLGVPEWTTPRNTPNDGAELWEVFSDGREVLRAKFSKTQNIFIIVNQ